MIADIFDGSQVNLLIAVGAGVITFFASCLLPLVPTYLAYLSGVSLASDDQLESPQRWQVLKTAAWFVLGFVLTFTFLGLAAHQLASLIGPYRQLASRAAGVIFIGLGLFMLGVFHHPWLDRERKLDVHRLLIKHRPLHAVLTGVAFGFGWTPCIGPVLAVILFWASQAQTQLQGSLLLLAYGVGLGIPFLVIGAGFEKLMPVIKKYRRLSQLATIAAGLIVIAAGILFLVGEFQALSFYLLRLFNIDSLSA